MGDPTDRSSNLGPGRFVVGVDFGTTFTSVAWAHSSSESLEDVKLVQTWPNGSIGNSSADQVPTELHYSDIQTREKTWGHEIPKFNKAIEPLRWFKLLLQEDATLPAYSTNSSSSGRSCSPEDIYRSPSSPSSPKLSAVPSVSDSSSDPPSYKLAPTLAEKTRIQLKRLNIEPIEVIADFLSGVREVLLDSIKRAYESNRSDWVDGLQISYVLTVPAIWSDSAKDLMIQAATKAGFGIHRVDFNLVSEPEAAAAYTLKIERNNNLNLGDTYIICDAGGGTVDLISYKVAGLSPLRLDEAVSGSGGLCGSVFLNDRFNEYIRGVLGSSVVDTMKPRSLHEMFRTWEEKVKFRFGNNTNLEGWEVNVPGIPDNPEKNIEDCFHTMAYENVKNIFDPVVDSVIELVKDQFHALKKENKGDVKAILLVGGFGSSDYLRSRLMETPFEGTKLRVLQPINSRSAIARGALLRGLDGSIVIKRRARRYYGCSSSTVVYGDEVPEEHLFWNPTVEKNLACDRLSWHITKGQIVSSTDSTRLEFYRCVFVACPKLIVEKPLLVCDLDIAPDYTWRNPDAVHKLCTLRADLRDIPEDELKIETNSDGMEYYIVNYVLVMKVQDEVLMFELEFNGEVCGSVKALFE